MFVKVLAAATLAFYLLAVCGALEAMPAGVARGRIPPVPAGRLRPMAAAAATYTIHTVGSPSDGAEPAGFNNTGQIFSQNCTVWTGSVFTKLPLPSATNQCLAHGINDANAASGEYEIVGRVGSFYLTTDASVGFAVVGSGKRFLKTSVYYANNSSLVLGVNANQISLAAADFSPANYLDITGEQYFTATGGVDYLAQLQAPVNDYSSPVHNLSPSYAISACAFGGCQINDKNEVVGYDNFFGSSNTITEAVYTIGKVGSLVDLPIQTGSDGFPTCCAPYAFNDADQLLYDDNQQLTEVKTVPAVYNIDTGVKTDIPLASQNCSSAYGAALSMNNRGEVLGYVQTCAGYQGYFTWDATHGTQYLNALIPASSYPIYPLAVNDSGQILIGLQLAQSRYEWGTLNPIAPPQTTKANVKPH